MHAALPSAPPWQTPVYVCATNMRLAILTQLLQPSLPAITACNMQDRSLALMSVVACQHSDTCPPAVSSYTICSSEQVVGETQQSVEGGNNDLLNAFNVATFKEEDEDEQSFWNRLIPVQERAKDEPAAEPLGVRAARLRNAEEVGVCS